MEKIIIESPKYGTFKVLVDDEDFEELNQFKWGVQKEKNTFYVKRMVWIGNKRTSVKMHRFIMKLKEGNKLVVDHINHNGLDNQKSNLRVCTSLQNNWNATSAKNSSSKYLGVSWYRAGNKWHSQIRINGNVKHLGFFAKELDAAVAYDVAAIINRQEFVNLNVL
jgi:hypothetical protein